MLTGGDGLRTRTLTSERRCAAKSSSAITAASRSMRLYSRPSTAALTVSVTVE